MQNLKKGLLILGAVTILAGCSSSPAPTTTTPAKETPSATTPGTPAPSQPKDSAQTTPSTPATTPAQTTPTTPKKGDGQAVTVTAKPTDITVMVNKSVMLPDGYKPADLVEPNIPFIFAEHDEKRLMRKEAAQAMEKMVAGALKDGVHLAGVSGYRSYETQVGLFNYYVQTQGEELARKYSAEPGHSEHQTGLAMDVSGTNGKCAADDCFAGTPEAIWLQAHGAEYGFIVRYPKGKEEITGYAYEPWHMRYVGVAMAQEIMSKGSTLEEYYAAKAH
jgi:D-alanyl-D-alanine carboxypeptidase